MAENLLQDSKGKRRIDVGYEYLRDLELRSLIQPSSRELDFSMHDLVNDLARSVAGEFCLSFDLRNSFNVLEKTRYLSYVSTRDDNEEDHSTTFKGVSEAKRLRTFLPLLSKWSDILPSPLLRSEIWPLKVLRSLTLARAGIQKLPDSIGELKLLRYLDLSENGELNQLPESLASLYNLEVLNLYECWSLTKLPSKMRQLTEMNHLDIRYTRLEEMPLQIGRLKDLDVLTDFVVGKGSGSSIRELKELKYLRGDLCIRGLQNITHSEDALEANLKEKSYLEKLRLKWGTTDSEDSEYARIMLENLRPHVNLKQLYIKNYTGTRLPDWAGHYYSLVNLTRIKLSGFKHCFDLSPLGQLPSLMSLYINRCDSLVTLVSNEIPIELPNEIHHHHVGHFSTLVELKISHCPKLELPQHHRFLSVEKFMLRDGSCASLQFFPLSSFTKLKQLWLPESSLESLAVIDEAHNTNLEYLESIEIEYCPNFKYFNAGNWCAPKMTYLRLEFCESLKVLPENMCTLFPSLLKLELVQCWNLEALPQSGLPVTLRDLTIQECNKLIASRSSWGLQRLLSLSTFIIGNFECDDLESFPEEGLLPSSLSTLQIAGSPNLTNLNGKSFQLLTSLETLQLRECPKLKCLSEMPTSLSSLYIGTCPLLGSRCEREQGEDWSKIAHIPNIQIINCESEFEYDSSSN